MYKNQSQMLIPNRAQTSLFLISKYPHAYLIVHLIKSNLEWNIFESPKNIQMEVATRGDNGEN